MLLLFSGKLTLRVHLFHPIIVHIDELFVVVVPNTSTFTHLSCWLKYLKAIVYIFFINLRAVRSPHIKWVFLGISKQFWPGAACNNTSDS